MYLLVLKLAGQDRQRCGFQHIPDPSFIRGGTELQQLRKVTMDLFAQLAGEPRPILDQAIFEARQGADANDFRIVEADRMETGLIGAQRIG